MRRKQTQASREAVERREREDKAPRLADEIPNVSELSIAVEETAHETVGGVVHTKRVVIPYAPAHFEFGCGDADCAGGGYDVTSEIMRALKREETELSGEAACHGDVKGSPCTRKMRFELKAAYGDAAEEAA